ncbi:hypothetical protein FRC14_005797 [Serendipita sp. 396]|nr:hypothetical protein FRC14_005797 [Serendipita sp. 396]KAG8787117.1 hypothetical protein FRC15_009959 [Serendipita sp. 397]
MQRPCPTPWCASTALRLFSTSAVRNKPSRRAKNNNLRKALTNIPPVPDINKNSFAGKLLSRTETPESKNEKARKTQDQSHIDNINRIVTGWGEDKLAPPSTTRPAEELSGLAREKPAHDPRVDLNIVRRFESEAFHRHTRDLPLFERRIQVLLKPPNTGVPTLQTIELPERQPPLPSLAHSLDRVLFNPGAHWLRDPRSCVYNFDESLETIPDIHDFDFDRLTPYVRSSRDQALENLARGEGKRFAGSTSSLGGLLSHIYFLLANGREVDTTVLSNSFSKMSRDYTYGARWPGGINLRYSDGVYCIDSHEIEESEKHLLLNMGTMLEKFITHSPSDFDFLRRDSPIPDNIEELKRPETYRYSKSDNFIMRSQLDAHDPRLPGSGVFDIKSRAVVAIRYDPLNSQYNSGYRIRNMQGEFESFEREQYDLFRAAFLKYQFQVRIGGMDGIFVAYHNTAQMFGFQYYTLEDMDNRLFGGSLQGDKVFAQCVKCMEQVASEISLCYPETSVKCLFETSQHDRVLRIYVEPEEWDEEAYGERPVTQLLVTATNYMNQQRVSGPMDFGGAGDEWTTFLSITRSSNSAPGLSESIKKERDAIEEKKNTFSFWLPQGVNPVQMAERWLRLNYRHGKSEMEGEEAATELPQADPAEMEALVTRFKARQRPSDFVSQLRKLARDGRRYIDSLEKGTSEGGDESEEPFIDEGLLTSPSREVIQAGFEPSPASVSLSADDAIARLKPDAVEFLPKQNVRTTVPTDPSVDAIGMQVKKAEEQNFPNVIVESVEQIQVSTEVDVGENPAINDKPITSDEVEDGADIKLDIDPNYPVDILGSEEDILDPITGAASVEEVVPGTQLSEEAIERDDLSGEDQAWVTPTEEPTGVEAINAPETLQHEGGPPVCEQAENIASVEGRPEPPTAEPTALPKQSEPVHIGSDGNEHHNEVSR